MVTKLKQWEERCRRCGRCCYEKIEYRGEIYYTDTPCEWLDRNTRQCTVYPERHTVRPGCLPLTPFTVARGILPADCPYVQDVAGYRPPHLFAEKSEASR